MPILTLPQWFRDVSRKSWREIQVGLGLFPVSKSKALRLPQLALFFENADFSIFELHEHGFYVFLFSGLQATDPDSGAITDLAGNDLRYGDQIFEGRAVEVRIHPRKVFGSVAKLMRQAISEELGELPARKE